MSDTGSAGTEPEKSPDAAPPITGDLSTTNPAKPAETHRASVRHILAKPDEASVADIIRIVPIRIWIVVLIGLYGGGTWLWTTAYERGKASVATSSASSKDQPTVLALLPRNAEINFDSSSAGPQLVRARVEATTTAGIAELSRKGRIQAFRFDTTVIRTGILSPESGRYELNPSISLEEVSPRRAVLRGEDSTDVIVILRTEELDANTPWPGSRPVRSRKAAEIDLWLYYKRDKGRPDSALLTIPLVYVKSGAMR